MAPKITGFAGNSRVRRVLAAAALADVEVEHDRSFTMKSAWKTDGTLDGYSMQYLPILEDGDLKLQESGACAEYVASLGKNQTILPSDPKERAKVHQWQCTADQEIFIPWSFASYMHNNVLPYSKATFTAASERVMGRLELIDKHLLSRTFLVGERITLADIFVATACLSAFTGIMDASYRKRIPNVVRLVETVLNHPKLDKVFEPANIKFTETMAPYQAPQKEKQEKPKAAAAEAAPKAPKAPKAKKEKEAEDEDIDLVPEEPKAKNPLDDLPKSAFNLEEWKRQYSNLDPRKEALPWFYEKFDHDGFSIWRVDFKYNDELTQVFMSSNQVGGFFNRLEASRKYLFGSVGVLGKANASIISGALICRGSDYKPVVDVAPDWESYEYKKIDLSNADDKAFFEGAMAWDLVVDGKEWADGKNFK